MVIILVSVPDIAFPAFFASKGRSYKAKYVKEESAGGIVKDIKH